MSRGKEKIYSAAYALLAEGKRPTNDLVQRRTGSSFTTVTKYMKEFREENKAALEALEKYREPMPDYIKDLAETLWNQALAVAEQRFTDEGILALETSLTAKEKDLEEAVSLITDLKARLDERDKKYEQLHAAFMEVVKSKPDLQAVINAIAPKQQ